MLGIRINVDGSMNEIVVDNIIETLINETEYDYQSYRLCERIELFNNDYLYIYGSRNLDYPFNNYEFEYSNLTGDAFVVCVNEEGEFVNISIPEFITIYERSDDVFSSDSYLSLSDEDDTLSDDSFIIYDE